MVASFTKVSVIRPPIAGNLVNDKFRVTSDVKGSVLLDIFLAYSESHFRAFILCGIVRESPEATLPGIKTDETF
jgi:hypothetical protein